MVFDVPGWAVAGPGAPPTWVLACSPAEATVVPLLTFLLLGAAGVTLEILIRKRCPSRRSTLASIFVSLLRPRSRRSWLADVGPRVAVQKGFRPDSSLPRPRRWRVPRVRGIGS